MSHYRSPRVRAILRDVKQLEESLPIHPDSSVFVRQVCTCTHAYVYNYLFMYIYMYTCVYIVHPLFQSSINTFINCTINMFVQRMKKEWI